jgi:nitroreductase
VEPALAGVLEAGRLAPSTYNSQPWRFVWMRSTRTLAVLEETRRRIPLADPAGAETLQSLGACLANIVLAARDAGWRPEVELVADSHPVAAELRERGLVSGEVLPVALVRLPEEAARPPHLEPFARRRSERAPYDGRPLDGDLLDRAAAAAGELVGAVGAEPVALHVTSDPEKIRRAARLLSDSTHRELRQPPLFREVASWLRYSRERARETGDGEPLDAFGFGAAELWLARRTLSERWGPLMMRLGGAWRVGRRNASSVPTSGALTMWATASHGPSPWREPKRAALTFLGAGCAVEAVWLELSAAGAGLQFMTPCLLFDDARAAIAELFDLPDGRFPLSLQRVGYPSAPSGESPIRRSLAELVAVV